MSSTLRGALPSQHLSKLIDNRFIIGADKTNIKPASLDLTIDEDCYVIDGAFQVPQSRTVFNCLKDIKKKRYSLDNPLEKGKHYLIKIKEKFDLPNGMYGYANPKSTTGRLDVHARLLADGVPQNDAISTGFRGDLWTLVRPQSFSIKLYPGISLNQSRLFYSDARLSKVQLEELMQSVGLLYEGKKKVAYKEMQVKDSPNSIVLRLDGKSNHRDGIVGYKAKRTIEVIDYRGKYKADQFFVPIIPNKQGVVFLENNCFAILSSIESVMVPEWLACEMASIDDRFGEFRSHYAGFIDPGWGCGTSDQKVYGRPLTLEVRPFENIYVKNGQPIARIKYEFLAERPEIAYDLIASNYTKQLKAKLAKQFY